MRDILVVGPCVPTERRKTGAVRGALRQRWMVVGWTLKASLMDLPSCTRARIRVYHRREDPVAVVLSSRHTLIASAPARMEERDGIDPADRDFRRSPAW